MMPVNTKLSSVKAIDTSPPKWSACGGLKNAPNRNTQILQSKGFGGGVPLNTERAAVKPRVGI